ncbi:hypothetical protein B6I21_00660 [candidate division KSB1 bacterium 4572_119]|nr:MAG: hypothetical protein B6I21_00660 [candidate division KSB1 bacterium 4572_119]
MNPQNNKLNITIDNKLYAVKKGSTILNAAQENNIYIPTLCAHKDLTPYGGCRMCIVEVEGARNFLTACTTPVEEGMIIRTHTDQIQKERKEILELVLSEHTSSCLICDEKEACRNSMTTIRKAGVTTGCRYCPNDDKCELEEVVSWLKIDEINHPVFYRGIQVEKNDPFYDRDYNLCIYCGRCVRMCQEVRMANVLAFTQRGRFTVIGPAFGRTHVEAGCEFCGACVEVCPTGSLAEKYNKWDGVAEGEILSTCGLCGVGCQIRIQVKSGKVIGVLPAEDKLVNNGQLCVKGRFSVNELVNHYQRLKKPQKTVGKAILDINWDEAIEIAADKLKDCPPDEFAMIVSPNCTNEDLYIAQKFVRSVMSSNNIDTTARLYYDSGLNDYLNLMKKSSALSDMKNSSAILCLGIDLRYGRSVVGVEIRKALTREAKLITINPNEHSLSLNADYWLKPNPGEVTDYLKTLLKLLNNESQGIKDENLNAISQILKNSENPILIVGSEFLNYPESPEIFQQINQIADKIGAGILSLPAQNNLYGSLLMGAYPELVAGGTANKNPSSTENNTWNTYKISSGKRLKVAYIVGETEPTSKKIADFVIYQNIYPVEQKELVDLSLPAAAFTETDGTFINGEGRIQFVNKAIEPPGVSLPDWKIICKIAQKMGAKDFDFSNVAEIQKEISQNSPRFKNLDKLKRKPQPLPEGITLQANQKQDPRDKKTTASYNLYKKEHVYRGIPLTDKVEGLKKLIAEE